MHWISFVLFVEFRLEKVAVGYVICRRERELWHATRRAHSAERAGGVVPESYICPLLRDGTTVVHNRQRENMEHKTEKHTA